MGIAASVAGRCNLRLQFAISRGFGGRNSLELLVFISTTEVRFAWAMTLIFEDKKPHKAKQFAKWGVENLGDTDNDWFGKADFDRVLKNNGA